MKAFIAVASLALLAALIASLWMRRGEWDAAGSSGATLLGVVFAFVAVVLILVAVAGGLWS